MKLSALNQRVFYAILAMLAVFSSQFSLAPASAAIPDKVTVTVHYHRTAGDYATWNVFTWKEKTGGTDGSGPVVNLDKTDAFGAYATFSVNQLAEYDGIGFILRPGENWAKADRDATYGPNGGDRFLMSFPNAAAEIWLIEGDKTIYTSAPAVGAAKPQMLSAVLADFRKVELTLNQPFKLNGTTAEGFTVTDSQGATAAISSVTLPAGATESTQVTLNLVADILVSNTYTIKHEAWGQVEVTVGAIMDSKAFEDAFTYTGNDLGNTYSVSQTSFRVWAPTATAVQLVKYASANDANPTEVAMTKSTKGTWTATLSGDQHGIIYTYRATVGGEEREAVDPYVRATTIDGDRGVVVDLAKTNPDGWSSTAKPAFSGKSTDAIVYETHVRDLSIDANSGIPLAHKGKFLAFTDLATTTTIQVTDSRTKKKKTVVTKNPSGLAAIKDLGVTHVQLLPIYDFASVSEWAPSFNWGYDPKNYNVPEGSYATAPSEPTNRIVELKSAVKSMHANGLRLIMDVVYNHVYDSASFSEELLVPGYFFRTDSGGNLANGTGCGNEVASERSMVRKFIVDSVKYWASEYNLDGFRFDLMGILDVTTMNQIRTELNKIDPTILIIGEGWNMGDVLQADQKAAQINAEALPGISMFNDQIRDGLKGSVFNSSDTGWVTGKTSAVDDVKAGIVGNIAFDATVSPKWTTLAPGQSVNYVEAHDNLSLFDKLKASMPKASKAMIISYDRLAAAVVLLAQGLPFIQAGQEFLRTKNGDDNSYKSSDAVNSLKWNSRSTNIDSVKYYKGLIAIRKLHGAFRMTTAKDVQDNLKFIRTSSSVIAYSINGRAVGDIWDQVIVIHNSGKSAQTIKLPSKTNWKVVVSGSKVSEAGLLTLKGASSAVVAPYSTLVLHN